MTMFEPCDGGNITKDFSAIETILKKLFMQLMISRSGAYEQDVGGRNVGQGSAGPLGKIVEPGCE